MLTKQDSWISHAVQWITVQPKLQAGRGRRELGKGIYDPSQRPDLVSTHLPRLGLPQRLLLLPSWNPYASLTFGSLGLGDGTAKPSQTHVLAYLLTK